MSHSSSGLAPSWLELAGTPGGASKSKAKEQPRLSSGPLTRPRTDLKLGLGLSSIRPGAKIGLGSVRADVAKPSLDPPRVRIAKPVGKPTFDDQFPTLGAKKGSAGQKFDDEKGGEEGDSAGWARSGAGGAPQKLQAGQGGSQPPAKPKLKMVNQAVSRFSRAAPAPTAKMSSSAASVPAPSSNPTAKAAVAVGGRSGSSSVPRGAASLRDPATSAPANQAASKVKPKDDFRAMTDFRRPTAPVAAPLGKVASVPSPVNTPPSRAPIGSDGRRPEPGFRGAEQKLPPRGLGDSRPGVPGGWQPRGGSTMSQAPSKPTNSIANVGFIDDVIKSQQRPQPVRVKEPPAPQPISVPDQVMPQVSSPKVDSQGEEVWNDNQMGSSLEAEERLLREMGWISNLSLDDGNEEDECGLTEEEIAAFQRSVPVMRGVQESSPEVPSVQPPSWMEAAPQPIAPADHDITSDDSSDDDM